MKIEKIINMVFAFGAAIVIFGAWQKITHQSLADLFLTIGLITEVVLFCIMGVLELFEPPKPAPMSQTQAAGPDNSELSQNIKELNQTIKNIFNR